MSNNFAVHLAKHDFTFCSAHFITFGDNICEPLHGHNYGVEVELSGPLAANQYVVDFIAARDALTAITKSLDHRVLLPTTHPAIQVTEEQDEITARFENRRWVFPRTDCVLLPVANTTAELLANYIGEQLLAALAELGFRPSALKVAVDECEGQMGICHWAE